MCCSSLVFGCHQVVLIVVCVSHVGQANRNVGLDFPLLFFFGCFVFMMDDVRACYVIGKVSVVLHPAT